ncbi:MAG TPA: hypothetical protein VGD14_03040, partial [bacterium]
LTQLTQQGQYHHTMGFTPDGSPTVLHAAPRFSPDGAKIVFTSYDTVAYNFDIYLMESSGANHKRLTKILGYNTCPHFTPDGSKIVFLSHRDEGFQLYSMNLDGSHQTNLNNGIEHALFSQFSPDGKKILYFTNKDEFYHKIFLMNIDGTNQKKLTSPNSVTDYYDDMYPVFQPTQQF